MISLQHADLDARILRALGAGHGTAWFLAGTLGLSRETVSARLKSMKRRGVVSCEGSAWTRTRGAA